LPLPGRAQAARDPRRDEEGHHRGRGQALSGPWRRRPDRARRHPARRLQPRRQHDPDAAPKNLVLHDLQGRGLISKIERKGSEVWHAGSFDGAVGKQELLAAYLNQIEFGGREIVGLYRRAGTISAKNRATSTFTRRRSSPAWCRRRRASIR
jgi:hypothetical protein